MKFKQPIPAGLKFNLGFDQDGQLEFGDYTLVSFWTNRSGMYDLSLGNNQREAMQYLTPAMIVFAVYDKDGKYITLAQSNDFGDIFKFNGTVVLTEGRKKYHYFDVTTKKFIVKNITYPFDIGRGGQTKFNEATEDVAIFTHTVDVKIPGSEVTKCAKALVDYYNSFNPKIKIGKLGAAKQSQYHKFDVNVMIDKNFEVEAVERYWYAPMETYGFKQLFVENDKFNISKVLVP